MALLSARDLTLGYSDRTLVRNMNFELNEGNYLCIVGENGSGKSTLMRTLLGLQSPLSGKVLHGDGLSAREIGYLPQQTPVQRDFPASVSEIVLSGCQNRLGRRFFYTRQDRELARRNMELMSVSDLAGKCYRNLSGGQQQRVLLARALCATRRLLLLDEPVAGLDPRATTEMYQLIRRLNREEKITIIMVSHDIAAAVSYATHILHIGETVFFGSREEYLESRAGREFLDPQREDRMNMKVRKKKQPVRPLAGKEGKA